MRKLELVWGICGLLGIFYPCSVSYYSYLPVQYAYLLYSGCYFGVWFGMILKRKFSAGQLCGIVSWGWVDFLVASLMLFLSVRACVDFKDNGFVLLQIAVSALGYYCFRNIPRKHFVWYIIALLIGGGIQIVYAFCTQADYFLLSEKGSRIYGSFLNTSVWGNYLALLLLMSLGVMAWGKRWCRLLLLIPCGLLLVLLGQSDSRTGWLAVCAGGSGWFYWRYLSKRKMHWRRPYLCFAVLIVSVFVSVICCSLYLHKKDSGNGRLLIWCVSCEMIKDAPLWGHGVDGFQKNYMLYQASFFNKYPTHKWRMLADDNSFAFNEYIKFVVEHGAVAAIFFFSFFLYVLLKQTGVSRLENVFSKSMLLGWGIIALFSYPFFLWQFIVLLLFFVAGIGGGNAMCMPRRGTSICGICKFIGISWMIILFWGGILYGRKTILLFNRGTSLYAARRLDEAKDALKCSFLYTPDYNTAMLLGEIYSELQKCDSATYYWHWASDMVPNRIMPHFYLFRLYRGCDIKKAYKEAELIKNMPVKVYAPQLNDIYREIDDFIGHVPKEYSGR